MPEEPDLAGRLIASVSCAMENSGVFTPYFLRKWRERATCISGFFVLTLRRKCTEGPTRALFSYKTTWATVKTVAQVVFSVAQVVFTVWATVILIARNGVGDAQWPLIFHKIDGTETGGDRKTWRKT